MHSIRSPLELDSIKLGTHSHSASVKSRHRNPFLEEEDERKEVLGPVMLGSIGPEIMMGFNQTELAGAIHTESLPVSAPDSAIPSKENPKHSQELLSSDLKKSFKFADPAVDKIDYHTPALQQGDQEHIHLRKQTTTSTKFVQQDDIVRGYLQVNQKMKNLVVLRNEGVIEVNGNDCCIIIQANNGLIHLRGSGIVLRISMPDKIGVIRNSGDRNTFQTKPIPKSCWLGLTKATKPSGTPNRDQGFLTTSFVQYNNYYIELPEPDPADIPKAVSYSPTVTIPNSLSVSVTNPFELPARKQTTMIMSSDLQRHEIQPIPFHRRNSEPVDPEESFGTLGNPFLDAPNAEVDHTHSPRSKFLPSQQISGAKPAKKRDSLYKHQLMGVVVPEPPKVVMETGSRQNSGDIGSGQKPRVLENVGQKGSNKISPTIMQSSSFTAQSGEMEFEEHQFGQRSQAHHQPADRSRKIHSTGLYPKQNEPLQIQKYHLQMETARSQEVSPERPPQRKPKGVKAIEVRGGTTSIKHDCPICYAKFDKMEFGASYLDCGHWFHYCCLKPWLDDYNTNCPQCKAEVTQVSIIIPRTTQ